MQVILGRILSALVIAVLIVDAAINLFFPEALVEQMADVQFPVSLSPVIGVITLVCAALYALPRTSVVGAILITGFFGGAIAIHLRVGEFLSPPQLVCLALSTASWLGICLRDKQWKSLFSWSK
jgi:hypothetical protein